MKIAANLWLLLGLSVASPAWAGFTPGDYSLTFYGSHRHLQGATQCITFVFTGGVPGFKKSSGTWDSSTYGPGWGGNWIYDDKYLRFYGAYDPGTGLKITNFYTRIATGKGGFDEWRPSTPPVEGDLDGEITLVPGCDGATGSHTKSPMG